MGMKRRAESRPVAGQPAACQEGFRERLPALASFLTDTVWEDGSPRQVGSMLVVAEDGLWKAWLNDRGNGVTAWVSALTWGELFVQVETGLEADSLGWRPARRQARKGGGS
jgi:hypothetical protein